MPYIVQDPPVHVNGTATDVPANLVLTTAGDLVKYCNIQNTGDEVLDVSFDGGTTYFPLQPQASLPIEANIRSLFVQAEANTTTYAILFTRSIHVSE